MEEGFQWSYYFECWNDFFVQCSEDERRMLRRIITKFWSHGFKEKSYRRNSEQETLIFYPRERESSPNNAISSNPIQIFIPDCQLPLVDQSLLQYEAPPQRRDDSFTSVAPKPAPRQGHGHGNHRAIHRLSWQQPP